MGKVQLCIIIPHVCNAYDIDKDGCIHLLDWTTGLKYFFIHAVVVLIDPYWLKALRQTYNPLINGKQEQLNK